MKSLFMIALATVAMLAGQSGVSPSVNFSDGPLKVSENKRFLVHANGTPFFWLGDTAWELFHRLDLEEAERYLENRRARGFNVIQAVVLAELDGLGKPNRQGHLPLIDNDPSQPNEAYFRDVDAVVNMAERRGMFIGLLPTWGSHVNGSQQQPGIFTPENARHYGEFLAKRYRDKPIIWIIGGDRAVETDQQRAVWHAMATSIRAADGGRHLMTFHPRGRSSSSQPWHEAEWLDFNMFQSGHREKNMPNYQMVESDYVRKPTKPVLDGEPRYEDHPVRGDRTAGHFDDFDVRQAAYWAVFSGAFGHTYGHHSIWMMHSDKIWLAPRDGMINTWDVAIDRPGGAQMGHLRRLMESRPFVSGMPDQSLIVEAFEGIDHVRATRGDGYAMMYLPTGKQVTVRMGRVTGDKVKASWFNPRSGELKAAGEFDNRGERQFAAPSSGRGNDWVLVLDDSSKQFSAPRASR